MKITTRICHRSKRAFALIELLVVIAILGLLMAMISGVSSAIISKRRTAVATTQLPRLVSAIEEYKLHYGQYPPANPRRNTISNAHHTSLFYELTGTQLRGAAFESPAYQVGTRLSSNVLMNAFGLPGLVNHSEGSDRLRQFLTVAPSDYAEVAIPVWAGLADRTPVLLLRANVPRADGVSGYNFWNYRLNPADGHNPGSYDLWVEFGAGKETVVVGNWQR